MNQALRLAQESGGLDEWEDLCGELADHVLHAFPKAQILYVELIDHEWGWHMVPVIDGIVHDAWHPASMLPPDQYVYEVFKDHATTWEVVG